MCETLLFVKNTTSIVDDNLTSLKCPGATLAADSNY